MFEELYRYVPREAVEIAVVLFLSFLLGLEREEHKVRVTHYAFGGVRTFPLIGFVGYGIAYLSRGNVVALAIGFVVVGGMMAVSYAHKLRAAESAGATTEISGLLTYVLGALVHAEAYWIAVTIGVVAVLLLELHDALDRLTRRLSPAEVFAFTKFLLLAIVILPALPDEAFTRFAINPFRAWLVIVAVSAVSYASYLLQRALKDRGGVLVSALLGGAYSSTVATVVLARRSREDGADRWLYAGSMLATSGVMYLRLTTLVFVFDRALARALAPWFCSLAVLAIAAGLLIARRGARPHPTGTPAEPRNPLELRTPFLFALLFVAMIVVTRIAVQWSGGRGLYAVGALAGLGDIDPFVLGASESAAVAAPVHVVAIAVTLAAASNNVVKGAYAMIFGERRTGRLAATLLVNLAIAGLAPVLWL